MLPVLRDPSPLSTIEPFNRLESLLNQFFGTDGGATRPAWTWTGIPVAMWEDDDRIYVEAELPGVTDKDVDLTVHNGMLFIRGERRPEEGRNYLYNGRAYGRFERVITLPEAVQTDDVQATLKDGILSLTLPKSPEAKPRKIALQAG